MKMTSYSPQRSLYGRSKRILTSIAGRESSGENCRQLFPKSRADALALRLFASVCVREISCERRGGHASTAVLAPAPILMCESLGTITTITGPVASHHTIRVRRFPRPLPFTLRANLERTFLKRYRLAGWIFPRFTAFNELFMTFHDNCTLRTSFFK